MKKAVVIIPTYNERDNIVITIARLFEVFSSITDWKMSVLVVDDTSPDKTYEVVTELKKKYPHLELLLNKEKSGLGGAYMKGMAHAFETMKADVVFEFDADLSHDPTKIEEFLRRIEAGADMVLGNRYTDGGGIPQDWGIHRKFLSIFGNWIIMVVFADFRIRDWTSGYRALTRPVFEKIKPRLTSDQFSGYTFQIGSLYHALREGFVIDPDVAYHFTDRTIGESKIGPEYIKNTLLFIFSMRLKELFKHRLFKFAITGGIGAIVQAFTLYLGRSFFPFQLAYFLSVEAAVISNFILSNLWTFSDKKLPISAVPKKFLQFNLASSGSIMIQQGLAYASEFWVGIDPDLTLWQWLQFELDAGFVIMVIGIFLGMCWNFFAYNRFIWKTHLS